MTPTRWMVLSLMSLAHALGSLAALAVAPLAPFLLDGLRLSRVEIGLFLPAVYLGGVLMSLPAGALTERYGVGRPLASGLVLIALAVALTAFVRILPLLLALLVMAGFGFSILNPTTGRAIYDWFPPRECGLAMGVKQAGLTLGGIVSALLLPPIAMAFGWQAAVLLGAALSLLAALLVTSIYREAPGRVAQAVPSRPRLAELAPLVSKAGVLVVLACGLGLGVVQSSVLAYLVLYARDTFALSSVDAARLLALAHVGGAAGRLGWGVVSDRFFGGRRRPGLALNALVAALGLLVFALGGALSPFAAAVVAFVAGLGAFGWVGLFFALMAEIGGARFAGLMTGLGVIFAWGGVLVGPPLFGALLEATDSYRIGWLGLSALAVAVAAILPRLQPLVRRSEDT
ncbi:MAG: MFS transporter [Candidatus Rokuibacteriota bacterium]